MKKLLISVLTLLVVTNAFALWSYDNLDGHLDIDRTALGGGVYQWTYTFWHGNLNVPQDPVDTITIRIPTPDDGLTTSGRIWDYEGWYQVGSGPGGNGADRNNYTWNAAESIPTSNIAEFVSSGVTVGRWVAPVNNEYMKMTVSFKENLGGVTKDYVDLKDQLGFTTHAVIGEVPTVPEPGTIAAFITGLTGLAGLVIRRNK